ncbi:hypothetical protein ACLQ29_32115 [Micromonospora sp. DT228]|uniref:hypothetical protein n=1 Tax=Micromonospora sp. DT228 TaxID=3393443 RepID=UPI003CEFA243
MSWVTNVMLSVDPEDRLNAEAFSGWLDKECPRREPGMGSSWHHPSAVQLLVMDQEESFFRVWMIRDGALRQYAPSSPDEEDDEFWPTAGS